MRSLMRAASSLTELASACRSASLSASRLPASVAAPPAMVASGVRRSCEIEASSALRIASVSARTSAAWACAAKSARSQCQSDLRRKGLEQPVLLGQRHAPRIVRQHRQHAEHALAAGERQIQPRARRAAYRCRGPRACRDRTPIARPPRSAVGVGLLGRLHGADSATRPCSSANSSTTRGWRTPGRRGWIATFGHLLARRAPSPADGSSHTAAPCAARDDPATRACRRTLALRLPMISATTSMIAKVIRYCASLTANE